MASSRRPHEALRSQQRVLEEGLATIELVILQPDELPLAANG